MRLIVSALVAAMFLPLTARAETYIEPTVFDTRVGSLGIYGYEDRTRFTWHRGSQWSHIEVAIPFYALVAGLAVGAILIGISVYLRRRHAGPRE